MNHRSLRNPAFLVALGLLVLASLGMSAAISGFKLYLTKKPIYPPENRQLISLPKETSSWIAEGSDQLVDPDILKVLGTSNYVTRRYVRKSTLGSDSPEVLDFHAAYYTGMIDTVPHVPDRCFVGGGHYLGDVVGNLPLPLDQARWSSDYDAPRALADRIVKMRVDDLHTIAPGAFPRLPRDPKDLKLRTMQFLTDGGDSYYAGYFFIANGGAVCRAEDVRLLAFDLKSTYAYYLKVQFTSSTVQSGEELAAAAADLLNEIFPEIMLCAPDWVLVESGEYPPDNPLRQPAPGPSK